jgi:hypothetical protein
MHFTFIRIKWHSSFLCSLSSSWTNHFWHDHLNPKASDRTNRRKHPVDCY